MSHVSSNTAVHSGIGVRQPATARHTPASPGWWRSLWSRRGSRFAEVRDLMLAQLDALPYAATKLTLAAKIAQADHPQALWALRQDLMAALVEVHGEMLARRRLTDITFMFAGLLDRRQHPRADLEDAQGPDDGWDGPRGLARTAAQMRSDH